MSKNKKPTAPKPEAPKTKDLRITDMQFDMIFEGEKRVAQANADLQNVMACIFAAHSMVPVQIIKLDQDKDGRFLVVQG